MTDELYEKAYKWLRAGLMPQEERLQLPKYAPVFSNGGTFDAWGVYDRVKPLHDAYPYNNEHNCAQFAAGILDNACRRSKTELDDNTAEAFLSALIQILRADKIFLPSLSEPEDPKRFEEYCAVYRSLEDFYTHADEILDYCKSTLTDICASIISNLPRLPSGNAEVTIPLIQFMRNPFQLIHLPYVAVNDLPDLPRTLNTLWYTLRNNLHEASKLDPNDYGDERKRFKFAGDLKGQSLEELVDLYLKNTALKELFMTPVPFSIPHNIRFEHTHILGGSGHGKTTLLTQQFLQDVQAENSPAIIIIDGKGTFVSELQRLDMFAPDQELSDRLVFINPEDMYHPPALNMFAVPKRYAGYDDQLRRQIENNTISLFSYIFSARDFKLSEKMTTCLSYAVRLLFSMDTTPTLFTLLDLLSEQPVPKVGGIPPSSKFKRYIEAQPEVMKRFFTDLFFHPTEYTETKRQIQNRIYSLLENPAFASMFTAEERKLDLYDIMRDRKILLVNASPSVLGEKAAPLLGRYITAMALASAYERLATPRNQWTPAFLVLDEAQMFVDEDKTQPLLQQAREFNLGVVLAHQKLDDLSSKLIATVAANTSIRYVGGVSAQDASFMAKNMRSDPDFILDQRKSGNTTSFATYVRGFTERPVSLSIPLGILDREPKMHPEDYAELVDTNRALLASTAKRNATTPTTPSPVEDNDREGSKETW